MLRQQAGIPCQDDLSRLPGHWLLARMGKKVLHPGGRELTEKMIGALRIGFNILNNPAARKRILTMRSVFNKYASHLEAISLIAIKKVGT